MRQWLRVMGVTVVSDENQYFPADGFEAKIGQNEINGRGDGIGVGVKAQAACMARCWSWACARSCGIRWESVRNVSASRGCFLAFATTRPDARTARARDP